MKKIFFIVLAFVLSASFLQARRVKGIVRCENSPLKNVLVTDGENFTKTDKSGKFKFDIKDEAWFVYIVTPSGYTADFSSGAPEFYKKAEGRKYFEFDLLKTSDSKNFKLFAVSDPQMGNEEQFSQFLGKPLQDLKNETQKAAAQGIAAGIALGDLSWDAMPVLKKYKEVMRQTGLPFYAVIGNHDFDRKLSGKEAAKKYCSNFGPYNHAFYIGSDLVIGLNNIIYDTDKKYEEGYSDEEFIFMKNLLKHIPENVHIFIAQHSPLYKRWSKKHILRAEEMLRLLEGRKVDFISGHTHFYNNTVYSENIMEHNIASICGSWWKADWCTDGSPRGYKVFTSDENGLRWLYYPTDYEDDYQVKINSMGQSKRYPNAIVANIWDYDPSWSVKWYQDGKDMGAMKQVEDTDPIYIIQINEAYGNKKIPGFRLPTPNIHYFIAEPCQYAKKVKIEVKSRFGKTWTYESDLKDYVDVQAHRGGAGLFPENTLSAMKNAIDLGVNTLEMDLQISKDGFVVVSHDRYFHSRYAIRPDGSLVEAKDAKEYLYTMPYDSIAKYEVGMRPSSVWPGMKNLPEKKPLASELIDLVEKYTAEKGFTPMRYNIEIKSSSGKGEGKNWPEYKEFVDKCVELLLSKNLGDRLVIQSFDVRALNYMNKKYPSLVLSYLTDEEDKDWDVFMGKLDFTPIWLSPNYKVVDEAMVKKCHEKGIKIVPWTCDAPEDMRKLIDMGVDALISNYPDRLLKITRGYL